ncbi:MAG: hypothetical protein HOO96_45030 [Polyangiaceae bacterium]|nr:hypothetical protein [Polyangiaceae bacterium]
MRLRRLLLAVLAVSFGAACSFIFPFDGLEGAPLDAGAEATALDATFDAGPCPDGGSLCNGACVNLKSDPRNCGVCTLACKEPTCGGGFCQALSIVGERGDPDNIVVEGSIVSWMVRTPDATKIFRADLAAPDAGASRRITKIPLPAVYDLAVTQNGYIYRTSQAIYALPKDATDAGAATVVFNAAANETIAGVVATDIGADTRIAYLLQRAGSPMFNGYRVVIGGSPSGPVQRFVANGPGRSARYMWTNGDDVYFFLVDPDSNGDLIRATNVFGGASDAISIKPGQARPTGLTGDDAGFIAWTASNVVITTRSGSNEQRPLPKVGANDRFSQLAMDAREIYYLSPSAGALRRIPRDGGAAVSVGAADDAPSSVTLTADYALWIRDNSLFALRR